MKKFVQLLSAFLLFALLAGDCYGVEVELFNETFVRGIGSPITEARTFPGKSGTAMIKLVNGSLEDSEIERVSSSIVTINGKPIFTSSDFNQNVNYLEKEIRLAEGQNSLSVILKSKPEGQTIIQITQNIEADAGAVVGSLGGEIQSSAGYSIYIPDGNLGENIIVSLNEMSEAKLPSPLPEGTSFVSALDIKPDGLIFNKPATITLPINISLSPGTHVPIFLYDNLTNEFIFEVEGVIGDNGNNVYFNVNHTSLRAYLNILVDDKQQMLLKSGIESRIFEVFQKYKDNCFYQNGFFNMGNIDLVQNRLYDDNVEIFIEKDFLDCTGTKALYLSWIATDYNGCQLPKLYFWEDIIIDNEPSNIDDPKILYHEIMHAIFDDGHRDELQDMGIKDSDEEQIPEYMEGTEIIFGALVSVENELDKARNGEPSNRSYIENQLDFFVERINYYKESSPLLTEEVLRKVKEWTGFYIMHPEEIKQRYLNGECGLLPPPAPLGLTATAISPFQINLLWEEAPFDQVNGIPSYKIYRDGEYLDSAGENSFSDITLNPSTIYCYTVSTYDEAGLESVQSVQICTTTHADPSTIDNDGDNYSEIQGDCNDSDPDTYPNATEICGDGIDQDCADGDLPCIDDSDWDNVLNDGDNSGTAGDNPCKWGQTQGCDDNCPDIPNPDQKDKDWDGLGDLCDPFYDSEIPQIVYIEPSGECGGKWPCLTSIRKGLDNVGEGAIINVAQGTYYENIMISSSVEILGGFTSDFDSRSSDPSLSVIDGSFRGSVIYIEISTWPWIYEQVNVAVNGLTIRKGVNESGGGIYAIASGSNDEITLTLDNVSIIDNQGYGYGGGIYVESAGSDNLVNVSVNKSFIENNEGDRGGGFYIKSSGFGNSASATLTNTSISNNSNSFYGGGIYVESSNGSIAELNLTGNTISGNSSGAGGGIYATSKNGRTSLTLNDNTIENNSIDLWRDMRGGGIYVDGSGGQILSTLKSNIITNNGGYHGSGGGISAFSNNGFAELTLINNTVKSNYARTGGGISVDCASGGNLLLTMIDNNISGNRADKAGGGIYAASGGETTVNLNGNTISDNYCWGEVPHGGAPLGGGGVYADSRYDGILELTLSGNTITSNKLESACTYSGGGGINILASDYGTTGAVILDNIITGNNIQFGNGGGGIYGSSLDYGKTSLIMEGNIINENYIDNLCQGEGAGGMFITASNSGRTSFDSGNNTIDRNYIDWVRGIGTGGLMISSDNGESQALIEQTTISLNSGGIAAYSNNNGITDITLVNNIVLRNESWRGHGGIYADSNNGGHTDLSLMNNTLFGNDYGLPVADIFVSSNSSTLVNLTNTIAPGIYIDYKGYETRVSASHSNIMGVEDPYGIFSDGGAIIHDICVDPEGRLYCDSPCVDSGTGTGAPSVDIDGDSRPQGSGIDMGADECIW